MVRKGYILSMIYHYTTMYASKRVRRVRICVCEQRDRQILYKMYHEHMMLTLRTLFEAYIVLYNICIIRYIFRPLIKHEFKTCQQVPDLSSGFLENDELFGSLCAKHLFFIEIYSWTDDRSRRTELYIEKLPSFKNFYINILLEK